MKLQLDHLYKFKNHIYYISKWSDGIYVEIFHQVEDNLAIFEDCMFDDEVQLKDVEEFKNYIEINKLKLKDLGNFLESNFEFRHISGYGINTNQVLIDLNQFLINTIGWFSNNFDKLEKRKLGILKDRKSDTYYIDHDGEIWSRFIPLTKEEAKIL